MVWGWNPGKGKRSSLWQSAQRACGVHLVGTGILSLGVKWLGCEDEHIPPIAEVENECCYTTTLPVCFHGMCSDNFTLCIPIWTIYAITGVCQNIYRGCQKMYTHFKRCYLCKMYIHFLAPSVHIYMYSIHTHTHTHTHTYIYIYLQRVPKNVCIF